jgi:DHA1 family bicyclomycin/chloramphenicol resistance-like MFS transporter
MPDSSGRQFITLVVLALTATLSPVSMDMLTPSLPGLATDMGTSAQTIELTLYSFLIGYGVGPSLWGVLSDRIGRRPIMFIGMLIYSASSLAGAVADDANWLIAVRFAQGIGAGAGATMARATVRDIHGTAGTTRNMARMISLMSVVPFFMPLLGGTLASVFSWKACFIVMSLIGAISVTAYFYLVPETLPARSETQAGAKHSIISIVTNPTFAQHAVCNMFCISTMVLFGANFAFITGHQFQLGSSGNGIVLALFNGSIAAGTYLVWWLMPKLGAHHAILTGAGSCALGWLGIALLAKTGHASLPLLAPLLVFAAAGCGVIMALCSGAALTPFTHQSGTASSLYLLLQSVGSSAISLTVGQLLPKQLFPIAAAITGCACLAIASKVLLSRREGAPGITENFGS